MTREEVIRLLRQFIHQFDGRDVEDAFVDEVLEFAADMLEQDARGWISVKDRLPNTGEKVIVFAIGKYDGFIGDTTYAISMMIDRPSGKRWAVPWQYFDVDYEITHWMPLPEPPKEENPQ